MSQMQFFLDPADATGVIHPSIVAVDSVRLGRIKLGVWGIRGRCGATEVDAGLSAKAWYLQLSRPLYTVAII